MTTLTVSSLKDVFGIKSDAELAKKMHDMNVLRVGTRQIIRRWEQIGIPEAQAALISQKLDAIKQSSEVSNG